MKDQTLTERMFSMAEFCSATIEIAGQRLEPDATKAYAAFKLAHAWPVRTVYGTSFHPGTLANSYASMLHQVFNWGHRMRAYDKSKEKDEISRDYILGSIVAVEFPRPPASGWSMALNAADAPGIRGAAVIHKQAEKVPQTLGEHLGGRHTWTVSLEVSYELMQSGFVVQNRAQAKKKQEAVMAETTPKELDVMGLGYVTVENAPEELLNTYNMKKRVVSGDWEGLPVTLLKGGINGQVHFSGVGMVRYGAEREAEIQQILATDPERLTEIEPEEIDVAAIVAYFKSVAGLP